MMQTLLIATRGLHFAASISLVGVFAFECIISEPAMRAGATAGTSDAGLQRRFWLLAWASLGLTVVSGVGWLIGIAADMSGKPLDEVLTKGVLPTVLFQTQFGEDWLLRLALAVLLAMCLLAPKTRQRWVNVVVPWLALGFATTILAGLAWAGHGAATPSAPGDLHLAGDIVHLAAAGLWLGTLGPLALLLAQARRIGDTNWLAIARTATRRYSVLALTSVTALLLGGLVNTWFLAGTVPALVGTLYGRLLLAKIGLFVVMLLAAAANLLRLTPRLANSSGANQKQTLAQLQRSAVIETALGIGIIAIVGVIGILPPGLHTEPGWPLPFRLEIEALSTGAKIAAALAGIVCAGFVVAAVVAAAAGYYRQVPALATGIVLCAAAGWVPLRAVLEPAYPTSFYASPQAYAAPSVVRGAALYAENCAVCHGANGQGNGPAAAGLAIHPADLIEPHLFAHSPGDMFWWISHGRAKGVMPGFSDVLQPSQRWDVINFVRARAAGILMRQTPSEVTDAASYPVPDFAFEDAGTQNTLGQTLATGPVLLVLCTGLPPTARLQQLAAAEPALAAAGLHVIAVALDAGPNPALEELPLPLVVSVAPAVRSMLVLFRTAADRGETELMLDRSGNVRARWTEAPASGLPDSATLAADAIRADQFAVAAPSHAGHSQ